MICFVTFQTYGSAESGVPDLERWVDLSPRPPFLLADAEREFIVHSIAGLCSERGWLLHAAEATRNEVRAIVEGPLHGPSLITVLKQRLALNLRSAGHLQTQFWAPGGVFRSAGPAVSDLPTLTRFWLESTSRPSARQATA